MTTWFIRYVKGALTSTVELCRWRLRCVERKHHQSLCFLSNKYVQPAVRGADLPMACLHPSAPLFRSGCEFSDMSVKRVHNNLPEMSHHLLLSFTKHPFVVVWPLLCVAEQMPLFLSLKRVKWSQRGKFLMQLDVQDAGFILKPSLSAVFCSRSGFAALLPRNQNFCVIRRVSGAARWRLCPPATLKAVSIRCSCKEISFCEREHWRCRGFQQSHGAPEAKSHYSHSTLRTFPGCELLRQHFIRRLNKEKESYKANPLWLHCHVESVSEIWLRALLMDGNRSLRHLARSDEILSEWAVSCGQHVKSLCRVRVVRRELNTVFIRMCQTHFLHICVWKWCRGLHWTCFTCVRGPAYMWQPAASVEDTYVLVKIN